MGLHFMQKVHHQASIACDTHDTVGAITLVWFVMQAAPGDPALMFVPPDFQGEDAEAYLEKINEKYGFNDPLPLAVFALHAQYAAVRFWHLLAYDAPGVGGSSAPHPQFRSPWWWRPSCSQWR